MPTFTLLNLETLLRKIGRGVVFYAHDGGPASVGSPIRWDGTSTLYLAHLGDTEGDIAFVANGEVATLTLPEISGGAIHDATYLGENPQLQLPIFLADPDLLPILSPTGAAGAGHIRVRDVDERTIVVFPEDLFRTVGQSYEDLSFVSGVGWQLNGLPLSAAELTLLGMTLWLWRGYFERPDRVFMGGHGDDGKNIPAVNYNVMMHPTVPDGQRLYTMGDPATAVNGSIDISGGS